MDGSADTCQSGSARIWWHDMDAIGRVINHKQHAGYSQHGDGGGVIWLGNKPQSISGRWCRSGPERAPDDRRFKTLGTTAAAQREGGVRVSM